MLCYHVHLNTKKASVSFYNIFLVHLFSKYILAMHAKISMGNSRLNELLYTCKLNSYIRDIHTGIASPSVPI